MKTKVYLISLFFCIALIYSCEKEKIPDLDPAITLPADQYAHLGAPTEWWWHVGTLTDADGRKFGFEINVTGMVSYAFTQIAIIDLQQQINYQKVNPVIPCPSNWAEHDHAKPWCVQLLGSASSPHDGAVLMQSIEGNPLNMKVNTSFIDTKSNTSCEIQLNLYQQGPPMMVFGKGFNLVDSEGTTPLTRNNYYYSLTNLQASGTITIGNEVIEVTGLTWMDHEYGVFPKPETDKPDIYEGIGSCNARINNSEVSVSGTAWIEQNLGN